MKKTLTEMLRDAEKKAKEINSSTSSSKFYEFPENKPVKIRIVPSLEMEAYFGKLAKMGDNMPLEELKRPELFYKTHSFHYIDLPNEDGENKGEMVYTHRKYKVDDKEVSCPFDEFARYCYESDQDKIKSLYSSVKRKKNQYFYAIVLHEGGDKTLEIIRDKSSDSALIKEIQKASNGAFEFRADTNLPLYKNKKEEDGEAPSIMEEVDGPIDLYDFESGYDLFVIKKTTKKSYPDKSGKTITYNKPDYEIKHAKNSRPLSSEEMELVTQRQPLSSVVEYIEDYNVAEKKLNAYLRAKNILVDPSTPQPKASTPKVVDDEPTMSAPAPKKKEHRNTEELSDLEKEFLDEVID